MDFYSQQDKARRNTSLLVLLFICAVLALIVITNVLVTVSIMLLASGQGDITAVLYGGQFSALFSWQRFVYISAVVCAVIVCAIAYKWLQLASGGKAVAESLGGQRILPNTDDRQQRQLLNVVEEMAIASGIPVPPVYLLADEIAINAFAAGSTAADAVIGVTRGTVDQLERAQLQGVVAHEFSHILNGDMRLNMRLIALLHGIVFIGNTGELLLRGGGYGRRSYTSSSRFSRGGRANGQLALLGLGLLIVGWLGGFFGSLIKAAVSRQREFLADASAVQFTRNPEGIAGALKIIGGYSPAARIINPVATQYSHLFFGQALNRLQATFASHPPLAERIERIDPAWDGQFIKCSAVQRDETFWQTMHQQDSSQSAASLATIAPVAASVGTPAGAREGVDGLPAGLREQIHEPFGAMSIAYCLLLAEQAPVRQKQLDYIGQTGIAGLALQVQQLQPVLLALDKSLYMPLVELAMPALKCLSQDQYKLFKRTLLLLIKVDGHVDLFEWCLYQLLRHCLDREFNIARPSRPVYRKLKRLRSECQLVVSVVAQSGGGGESGFRRAAEYLGLPGLPMLAENDYSFDDFTRAVNTLANLFPLLKPRLLKGLAECVHHDGVVAPAERELLLAIAAVMDCPLPRAKEFKL